MILRAVLPRSLTLVARLGLLSLGSLALAACLTPEPIGGPDAIPPAAQHNAAASTPAVSTTVAAAPVALARDVVEVAGHPITVWSKAPAQPTGVMVLVHGRTWSARPDFDLQVPGESRSLMDALVAEGFATYAVDQRGYGDTPRDDTGWLTPDQAETDLAAVLEWVQSRHQALPAPALLGWSLGSLISQLVAQRHPQSLSALVLFGYPRDPDRRYEPDAAATPARKATTAKAAAEDFLIPGSISPAAIEAFVQAAVAADPVRADWRGTDQWNALDPAAVHTPTLVIHGERDPYAPVASQAKLFARLGTPDRAWVVVAGGDHAAHLENNGSRFVHAVVQFVRRPTPADR